MSKKDSKELKKSDEPKKAAAPKKAVEPKKAAETKKAVEPKKSPELKKAAEPKKAAAPLQTKLRLSIDDKVKIVKDGRQGVVTYVRNDDEGFLIKAEVLLEDGTKKVASSLSLELL